LNLPALIKALRGNDRKFATLLALLSAGADPDVADRIDSRPLHEAVALQSDTVLLAVAILQSFGADSTLRNIYGATPLHYAVGQPIGRFAGRYLVPEEAAGSDPHGRLADVNAQDSGGYTPLHYLISLVHSSRDPRVAKWLVARGADPDLEANDGSSAMDWALDLRLHELIAEFLEYQPAAADSP